MPWRASRGLGTVPRWAGVGHLDRGMPCRAGEVSDTLRESDTVATTCLAGKVPESLTAKVSDTLRESGTVATACLAGKVPESLTAKVSDTLRESGTVATACLAGKVPESLTAKVSDTLRESGTVGTACLAGKVSDSRRVSDTIGGTISSWTCPPACWRRSRASWRAAWS